MLKVKSKKIKKNSFLSKKRDVRTSALNIKIDTALKRESQELFNSLGLSLNTAINIFLKQAVNEQAIPFRVEIPTPNEETLKAIKNAQNGIGLSREFGCVSELMEDLDADD